MCKRNALFLLALAGLLFSFSVGVLVSRPVTAQSVVGYPGMPLRQSDLWCYRITPETGGQFVTGEGKTAYGYAFRVDPDAAGRLPVVTLVAFGYGGSFTLWERRGDGRFWFLASGSQDYSPGFVLYPGDYMVTQGEHHNQPILRVEVALTGYWARP
ncbi:MAG: hypothetical protein AMXMBFR61_20890 [Fimbriimonadales bacterium]